MGRRTIAVTLAALSAVTLASGQASAAIGDLDPSYGSGGYFDATTLGTASSYTPTLGLVGDGSVLYARHTGTSGPGTALIGHRDANGRIDPAFGPTGEMALLPGFDIYDPTTIRDSRGRLLINGVVGGTFALARFNVDGTPDRTFAGTGVVSRTGAYPGGIALQPDGRIVAALTQYNSYLTVSASLRRFNVDGSDDVTFGNGGETATVPYTSGCCGDTSYVSTLPNGYLGLFTDGFTYFDTRGQRASAAISIIPSVPGVTDWRYAGSFKDGSELYIGGYGQYVYLARLLPDGAVDRTFGDAGTGVTKIDFQALLGASILGSIGGSIATIGDAGTHIHVALHTGGSDSVVRLRASGPGVGQLDNAWGRGGVARVPTGGYQVTDMVEQPDGAVVIATSRGMTMRLLGTDAPGGPGTVVFATMSPVGSEANAGVTLVVSRVAGSSGAISVGYSTGGGSATPSSDYTPVSGRLNWADGDTSDKSIFVRFIDDTLRESSETFSVTLDTPTGFTWSNAPVANVAIIDNDPVTTSAAASQPTSSASTGNPGAGGGGSVGGLEAMLLALLLSLRRRCS